MLTEEINQCVTACERLCHDFGWHVDHRDYAAFLDLFAEDGAFERAGLLSRGQDELKQFLDGRPLDMVTRHLFVGVRINPVSSIAAKGTSTCLVYRMTADLDQQYPLPMPPMRVVEFEDDFVRTGAGWRFSRRKTSPVFA